VSNAVTSQIFAKPARIRGGAWVYDKDLGCMVPKYGRNYHDTSEKRSDLPCPMMNVGKFMPDNVKSMVDGKRYSTFRNYEKSVHRGGGEIVGFDKRWEEHIKPAEPYGGDNVHELGLIQDVKKAIQQENSKLPPTGGLECRRLARKQRKERKALER
jgi:hypothetical protein